MKSLMLIMLGSYIYIFAAIISVLSAWLSDRQGQRSLLLFFHVLCIVVGYTIIISGSARGFPGVVYFGTFVVVSGEFYRFQSNFLSFQGDYAGELLIAMMFQVYILLFRLLLHG